MSREPQPQRPEDIHLIERFISAFNALDLHLQGILGLDSGASFRSMVDQYAGRHKWFRDVEQMRIFASLRNVIVHDKIEPYQYPCVPTPEIVECIESILERVAHPERAIPAFRREVVTVRPDDSLSSVLRLIHHLEYSQFPVRGEDHRFAGLLTENTITRWLARTTSTAISLIEFDEVLVRTVLTHSARRTNYQFMSTEAPVEEIVFLFQQNLYLEAVLITPRGREDEPLSGIVTRGDAMRWGG
jgi:predicted transcriptional regulator